MITVSENCACITIIQAVSDIEEPLLFSDVAVKAAKSENKKGFSVSEKARISITNAKHCQGLLLCPYVFQSIS